MKRSSTRTNQGGSILIFIIVAVALGLALIGAVLFVRHKGEVAQTRVPIMGPVTPPEVAKDGAGDQQKPNETKRDDSRSQPQPSDSSSEQAPREATPSPAPTAELPKTGLADVLGSGLVIALVTMVTVSYIRSRRLSWQV